MSSPTRASELAQKLNLFFISLFLSIALLFFRKIENNIFILAQYLSLLILQLLLMNLKTSQKLLSTIRDFIFPITSVFVIFDSLTELIPAVNPRDIDQVLIKLDYLLFGTHPVLYFERFNSPLLADIFQLSYCTYYFMPVALGILLKIHKKEEAFQKGLFLILLCFYLSYIGYLLFPALGPRYAIPHLYQTELKGYIFYEKINYVLNALEGIKRDAFPSGHTGVTLVVLHLAFKYEKKLFYFLLPLTILMLISTVYCRYHYVVDLIGGVGLYFVTLLMGRMIVKAINNEQSGTEKQI
jgi:membrane-associated phospholipid phosphatase